MDRPHPAWIFLVYARSGHIQPKPAGSTLRKGRDVHVVGPLKQKRWTNPEGESRSQVCIVGEHVEFQSRLRNGKAGDAPLKR